MAKKKKKQLVQHQSNESNEPHENKKEPRKLPAAFTEPTDRVLFRIFISSAIVFCLAVFVNMNLLSAFLLVFIPTYLQSYMDGIELKSGRIWPEFARLPLWTWIGTQLFPASIRYSTPIDSEKQYIFCSHPHGVMSFHHFMYMTNAVRFFDVSPPQTRRELAANVLFKIPGIRELMLWLGAVDASASVATTLLQMGYSLGILVGGEQEQIRTRQGEHQVYVSSRRGHLRLALKTGVPLVPIYVFGESDLYTTISRFADIQLWIVKMYRIAIPLFYGRWYCPFLPHKVPLVSCVGTPIEVERLGSIEPTPKQLDDLQKRYIQGVIDVFEANKAQLGYGDKTLLIM